MGRVNYIFFKGKDPVLPKITITSSHVLFYCIGIGIGTGKSLICIRVESMTSPIVIT